VDSSIASADSRQCADHSSFKSAVTEQQEYVTSTVTSFTASMHQMSDKMQQQSEDVDHFLSTELQQDVPTGTVDVFCCLLFMLSASSGKYTVNGLASVRLSVSLAYSP